MNAYLGALQQPLNPIYPSANALIQNLKYQTAGSNSQIGAMNTVQSLDHRRAILCTLDTQTPNGLLRSRGIKRDKLKGINGAKSAVLFFSQIFADFPLSWEFQHFGGADFRRKAQESADFRRNRFVPFSLSLLIPPYKNAVWF